MVKFTGIAVVLLSTTFWSGGLPTPTVPVVNSVQGNLKDRLTQWKVAGQTIGFKFKIEHKELEKAETLANIAAAAANAIPPPEGQAISLGIRLGYELLRYIDDEGGRQGLYICWTPVSAGTPIALPADRDEPVDRIVGGPPVHNPAWRDADGLGIPPNSAAEAEAFNVQEKTLGIRITSYEGRVRDGAEGKFFVQVQQGLLRRPDTQIVFGRYSLGNFENGTRFVPDPSDNGPVRRVHKNIQTADRDFERQFPGKPTFMAVRDILIIDSHEIVYGGFRVTVKNDGAGVHVSPVRNTEVNKIDKDGHYWFHVRTEQNGKDYKHDFIIHATIG